MRFRRREFSPWLGKMLCRRKQQPTPIFLPGKSHGQRNLASYSLWVTTESDTTQQLNNKTRKYIKPRVHCVTLYAVFLIVLWNIEVPLRELLHKVPI